MTKLIVGIFLSLFITSAISLPALAGGFEESICDLSKHYYSSTWYGVIILVGTASFMMAIMDRFAFSEMTTLATRTNKLKFRFEAWLPILRVFLILFAITIIYQIINAKTSGGVITSIVFLLFVLFLSWTTKCKLLLNPLKELDLDEIGNNDGKSDIYDIKIISQKHIAVYCVFYGITFAILYVADLAFTKYSCI